MYAKEDAPIGLARAGPNTLKALPQLQPQLPAKETEGGKQQHKTRRHKHAVWCDPCSC